MLKDEILKELSHILDENTIAFFSVTLAKRKDESIFPTMTKFGKNLTYEQSLALSDGLIELAQHIRQSR